jgi:hypothetical protein
VSQVWCNSNNIHQEMVDVGPGSVPCSPAECLDCGAHEIDWRHYAGLAEPGNPFYADSKYYVGYVCDPPPSKEEDEKGW